MLQHPRLVATHLRQVIPGEAQSDSKPQATLKTAFSSVVLASHTDVPAVPWNCPLFVNAISDAEISDGIFARRRDFAKSA